MKMRNYFPIHSFVGASSSSNPSRSGSGSVGLLGANTKTMVPSKMPSYYTPQKQKADKNDDHENSSLGSWQEKIFDSDSEQTDDEQPPKKKTKQTTEDVLASRRNTKKANKKAEKNSPAGTDIHTII